MLNTTDRDKQMLEEKTSQYGLPVPNVKLSIYKNRRGAVVQCFMWIVADKSTCRFEPVFMTDWDYNYMPMGKLRIVREGE